MYQSVNNIYLSERQIGEQCGGTVEQWNSDGGTVWWNSGTLMVEECDETVKTVMVEQCGGTFEQSWWNSVVEQWNSVVHQWNRHGGTVSWNSGTDHIGTVMVEQWNNDGGTVEH